VLGMLLAADTVEERLPTALDTALAKSVPASSLEDQLSNIFWSVLDRLLRLDVWLFSRVPIHLSSPSL
jgi:hypothetical protein